MFITYILQSQTTFRYYTGHTNNINERLDRHNSGRNKSTKRERPWVVVHTEKFTTKSEASKREKQIKSYKNGNAFKRLLGLV